MRLSPAHWIREPTLCRRLLEFVQELLKRCWIFQEVIEDCSEEYGGGVAASKDIRSRPCGECPISISLAFNLSRST